MTRTQAAIAAAAAAGAALLAWQCGILRVTASASAGVPALPPRPGGCPRHPLYRRHDGHAMRAALTGGGWAWYLDPPGSRTL